MNMYDEVQDQWANDPERHNLMHAVPQPAIPRNASFNKITEEGKKEICQIKHVFDDILSLNQLLIEYYLL